MIPLEKLKKSWFFSKVSSKFQGSWSQRWIFHKKCFPSKLHENSKISLLYSHFQSLKIQSASSFLSNEPVEKERSGASWNKKFWSLSTKIVSPEKSRGSAGKPENHSSDKKKLFSHWNRFPLIPWSISCKNLSWIFHAPPTISSSSG